jgi:tetratricopeptide (TPR) repeat protein
MNQRRRVALGVLFWIVAVGAGIAALPARAELVRMKDGSTLEGSVKHTEDGYDVTLAGGKVVHVDAEKVQSIDIGTKAPGAGEAESRLNSLRRSVENSTDIKAVLEKYARFIEQNKDTAVGREAAQDVATWKDRQSRGLVKVGPNWVTPAERDAMLSKSVETCEQARGLMKEGRQRDAEALIQQVLDVDPNHPAALYLRGIILYRQDQLPQARKAFEAVSAKLKDHGPTFNNEAVVFWKQNQQLQALNLYIQAMQSSPVDRDILNNVAEALNGLPQSMRGSTPAQKCFKLFTEQDTQLQDEMSKAGWYRWGSTWVDKSQLARLQELDKQVQAKLNEMSTEFDETRKKVSQIEGDIEDNNRRMRSIENSSYNRDPITGRIYRTQLPRRYYDLEDDNRKLGADHAALVQKLDELRAAAKQAQQQIPTPRFMMVQQLIGVEGAPLLKPMKPGMTAAEIARRSDLQPPKESDIIPAGARTGAAPGTTRPAGPGTQPAKVPGSLFGPE